MSRRCKPGQRARIIAKCANAGKIVVVVRHYFGELVSDAYWPKPVFPWVVTSLAGTLRSFEMETGLEMPPSMTIVLDDADLQPLDDDDLTDDESSDLRIDRPRVLAT